jgi:hypothetical protein
MDTQPTSASQEESAEKARIEGIEMWLSNFSKEAYGAYAKVDTINDRVRTLTPIVTILGAGFIYEASNYSYDDGAASALLFYLPISLGILALVVGIYIIVWSLVLKTETHVLADADQILAFARSHHHTKNNSAYIETEMIQKRCKSATTNAKLLRARCKALSTGSKLSVIAFSLLLLATPKFVHSRVNSKLTAQHEHP